MRSIACWLAAFGVIANLQPCTFAADPALRPALQQTLIRPPTPVRIKPLTGFASAPPRAIPRPGYLTQPPPPATRTVAARSQSQYSGASAYAPKAGPITSALKAPSAFVTGNSGFGTKLYPPVSSAGPTRAGSASRSDHGSRAMDVNLQRLVRYFEKGGQTTGLTNSSASFNPPVKEADLSKMLAPAADATNLSK